MNELQVFNFNGAEVRTQMVNEQPMFCLADVCKVLEIGNSRMVKDRLNEKGVSSIDTPTAGGIQSMTYITEQNLYKVIFQSRKPEAEQFTDWVTGEVLPAIRKSGGYMAAREDETPEMIMARALQIANETIERHKKQLAEAKDALAVAQPKAAFVDAFCVSRGTILVRDFAKHIAQELNLKGFGERAMFAYLKDNGYLNLNRYPTQRSTELGLLRVYEGMHQHNDGSTSIHHCSRITPKGQAYFFDRIKMKYQTTGRWW